MQIFILNICNMLYIHYMYKCIYIWSIMISKHKERGKKLYCVFVRISAAYALKNVKLYKIS